MASKQRNYSSEFKAKVVLEVISGKRSVSEASRAHEVHSTGCDHRIHGITFFLILSNEPNSCCRLD